MGRGPGDGMLLDRRQRIALALKPFLPVAARRAVRRIAYALDPLEVALYRRRSGERRPIPPRGLRERNAVYSVGYWHTAAEEAARPLEELLARHGKRIEDFERVLDFGSGAGKIESVLSGRVSELHACDIHSPSVEWIAATYPEVHAVHTGYHPPLPHADGAFDLVFAWSVLTHMDRDQQRAWLAEWARVIQPGGFILATIMGPAMLEREDPSKLLELERDGVLYHELPKEGAAAEWFHGTSHSYGDTYNSHASIPELLPPGLELLEIVEGAVWANQDALVLRRS